jgi:hypothetical protein
MFLKRGDLPPGGHFSQPLWLIEAQGRDLVIPALQERIEQARWVSYAVDCTALAVTNGLIGGIF